MTADPRDDLQATAESIVRDTERLKRIEQHKLNLEPSDDEEMLELAGEAERVAKDISVKARVEKQLADEIAQS